MTELVVQIEDASLLSDIKKAIKLMRGVSKVTSKKTKKSGLQLSIEEAQKGKIYEAKDLEDLKKQLSE